MKISSWIITKTIIPVEGFSRLATHPMSSSSSSSTAAATTTTKIMVLSRKDCHSNLVDSLTGWSQDYQYASVYWFLRFDKTWFIWLFSSRFLTESPQLICSFKKMLIQDLSFEYLTMLYRMVD